MTDQTDAKSTEHEAKAAKEREDRGIPPDMEERESKGTPHDDRLRSEVSHGRPDEPEGDRKGSGS